MDRGHDQEAGSPKARKATSAQRTAEQGRQSPVLEGAASREAWYPKTAVNWSWRVAYRLWSAPWSYRSIGLPRGRQTRRVDHRTPHGRRGASSIRQSEELVRVDSLSHRVNESW